MTYMNRFVPMYILGSAFVILAPSAQAEHAMPPVAASAMTQPHASMNTPVDANVGVTEETPNQRRHRLGQAIPSYAESYGEALETPNHRRQRLGLASAETTSIQAE
jgi:hypothetical protein